MTKGRQTPKKQQMKTVAHTFNPIDISVIVPVYNVEEYLHACIDSLLYQDGLRLEIILVNDGSTDRSGAIAYEYAQRDSRIKVVHRENGGASAARNTGLALAQGEYILFVDSDNQVKENSLCNLYNEAVTYQSDVVMGSSLYHQPNQFFDSIYQPAPKEILYIPLSGIEGFVRLIQFGAYTPVVWNYLYLRRFLNKIQARFEEGIMNEDELWCPVVLCQAERMIVVDIEFYYYLIREGSVMLSTPLNKRINSLFRVTDGLTDFAVCNDFSDKDGEFLNLWYANILKLYNTAFTILFYLQDTSYRVPDYHWDRFRHDDWEKMPDSQLCNAVFRKAKTIILTVYRDDMRRLSFARTDVA